MRNDQCIYCGSEHLIDINIEPPKDQNCRILQCPDCQVMFSELDQRFYSSCPPLEEQPKFDMSDETAALDAAFKLMKKSRWNHALELLFQPRRLSEHTAEFLVYRSVCQAAACLQQDSILREGKDYDHQYACGLTLTMLSHNLQTLENSLASETEEKRLAILRRITQTVKYFGSVTIIVAEQPIELQDFLAQECLKNRSEALRTLADYLESLQNNANGTAYLKMAAELLHTALGEYDSGSFFVKDSSKYGINLKLPDKITAVIKNDLQRLNSIIVKTDPRYLKSIKPPLLYAALSPLSIVFLCLALSAAIAGIVYLIRINHPAVSFIFHISDSAIELFFKIFMPVLVIMCALSWGKRVDTSRKRRQLYGILYKNGR